MEEKDDINKPPRESDGLNVVSAQKHWKNIASQLKINLRQEMELKLNLANTVFSTGSIITLFYFGNGLNLGQHLCDLEILLPRVDTKTLQCCGKRQLDRFVSWN